MTVAVRANAGGERLICRSPIRGSRKACSPVSHNLPHEPQIAVPGSGKRRRLVQVLNFLSGRNLCHIVIRFARP
jgi:hypothetical protein